MLIDFRSKYVTNIATILTGTAATQVLALLLMPVLARYYSVDDFGVYAVFIAIYGVISCFATGKYERVLFLIKSEDQMKLVSIITIGLSLLISCFSFIIFFFNGEMIIEYFDFNPKILQWLNILPLFLFLGGITVVLQSYLNVNSKYREITYSRVIRKSISLFFNLIFIIVFGNYIGLILGELLGMFFSAAYLFYSSNDLFRISRIEFNQVKKVLMKYKDFPLYNIPSDLVNVLTVQLPILILSSYYGVIVIGSFSLTKRVLDAPLNLISSSVLEVFRERASNDYLEKGNCRAIFVKTAKGLFFLGIIPILIIIFTAPYMFSMVFGEEWELSGVFAQILAIFYLFKFIVSPLSYMFYIAEKQRIDFFIHLYMLISTFIIMYFPKYFNITVESLFLIYSINLALIYILTFIVSYKLTIKD